MSSTSRPLTPSEEIEYILAPNRSWWRLDLAELFERRDLLFLLVRRDLTAKYKQTVLGPLWHIIQPLVMALVLTLVFSQVAAISTSGVPRILFYLASLLAWNYFSQNLGGTASTFTSNAGLFGKVYFPRLIVPLSVVLSNLFSLGLQFVVFLLFYVGCKLGPGHGKFDLQWTAVFLPVLFLQIGALSFGLGLLLSALTAKYRDLQHATPFLITIWMFATPVFYPISQINPAAQWLFLLNPMAPIVECFRFSLLGIGQIQMPATWASIGTSVLALFLGVIAFQRTERTVVDTV